MIQMRANIWQRNLAQTKNSAENLASLITSLTYVHHGSCTLRSVDSLKRIQVVCTIVLSILSGLKTRSLGLNTLGTG